MKKLRLLVASLLIMTSVVGASVLPAAPVAAQVKSPEQLACEGSGGTWTAGTTSCAQGTRSVTGTIKNVGNILIFITAAIAVLMIIIGGVRYTISGGDQGAINSAKNTILYAIIGLIVAVVAYAIVNFVLTNI